MCSCDWAPYLQQNLHAPEEVEGDAEQGRSGGREGDEGRLDEPLGVLQRAKTVEGQEACGGDTAGKTSQSALSWGMASAGDDWWCDCHDDRK